MDNPAAFKKVLPLTLVGLVKKSLRMILKGRVIKTRNFIAAELLNYFARKGESNKFYCNLCKKESPYFFHTASNIRILRNSICPNCSGRKRHRGLYEEYKKILSFLALRIINSLIYQILVTINNYTINDNFFSIKASLSFIVSRKKHY